MGLSKDITRARAELVPGFDEHRGRSVVLGGIAVIARVPRVTRDIDLAFSGADVPTGSRRKLTAPVRQLLNR